ncbi:MAG TPA: hypothetical protein VF796_29580 [Humisphaera sp.]
MKKFIRVKLVGRSARTAYVYVPGYQHAPGVSAKTVSLDDIIDGYKGPRVHLDFSKSGELIGIEVMVSVNEKRTPLLKPGARTC